MIARILDQPRLVQAREWFAGLALRERLLVGIAAAVIAVTLLFVLIWEPLYGSVTRLRNDVAATQQLIVELTQARSLTLSGNGGIGTIQGRDRSLLSIIDQTGKENNLASAITRMQPEGETVVRVWVEQADFAALLRWLGVLQTGYGISVSEAAIDREAEAGAVRARLGLVRGTP